MLPMPSHLQPVIEPSHIIKRATKRRLSVRVGSEVYGISSPMANATIRNTKRVPNNRAI